MLEIASQMILCLLLAALIGAIIGYILGKSNCENNTCEEETVSHDTKDIETNTSHATLPVDSTREEPEIDSSGMAPVLLSGPRNGEKDNLTRIKGIGLKIDGTLNDIGIYHFDQIAEWTDENITWADNYLGFPGRAKREGWVTQAKALSKGEETEFSKRVDAGEVASSKKA